MTLAIPNNLEQRLVARALQRNVSVDTLVGEALDWYLHLDPGLVDEFDAWEDVRDEALDIVEESSS